jgi:hypothetical protein
MGKRVWDIEKLKKYVSDQGDELVSEEYFGYGKRHEIKCHLCKKIYTTSPRSYIRKGTRCKKCSMNGSWNLKFTIDQIKEYCLKYDCQLITESYKSVNQEIEIQCKCGRKFLTTFSQFNGRKSKHQCQKCSNKDKNKNSVIPFDQVKAFMTSKNYKILNSNDYVNGRSLLEIEDELGYKHCLSLNFFKSTSSNNGRPEIFTKKNKFVFENIRLWIHLTNKNFDFIDGEFRSDKIRSLNFHCHKCDKVWNATWNCILNGIGCPYCTGKRVSEDNSLFFLYPEICLDWDYDLNRKSPKEYTYGSAKKVHWTCHKCNYKWIAPIKRRTGLGHGCPNCAPVSKGEDFIYEYLLGLGYEENEIKRWHRFQDCRNNKPLSFDFYMPSIPCCIEFQGLQHTKPIEYFGGLKMFNTQVINDKIKREYCLSNKIQFIEIFFNDDIKNILEKELSPFSERRIIDKSNFE